MREWKVVYLVWLCDPAINWRLIKGVPCLRSMTAGEMDECMLMLGWLHNDRMCLSLTCDCELLKVSYSWLQNRSLILQCYAHSHWTIVKNTLQPWTTKKHMFRNVRFPLRVGLLLRPTSQPTELQYERIYSDDEAGRRDSLSLSSKEKRTKQFMKSVNACVAARWNAITGYDVMTFLNDSVQSCTTRLLLNEGFLSLSSEWQVAIHQWDSDSDTDSIFPLELFPFTTIRWWLHLL